LRDDEKYVIIREEVNVSIPRAYSTGDASSVEEVGVVCSEIGSIETGGANSTGSTVSVWGAEVISTEGTGVV